MVADMTPPDSNQHRTCDRADGLAADIEKPGLLLGNVEFQIEQHLLAHGTRLAPETRWFLAQVRDALAMAFQESLEKAREDLSAGPEDVEETGQSGSSLAAYPTDAVALVAEPAEDDGRMCIPRQTVRQEWRFKGALHGIAGAACGALLTLLVLHDGSPTAAEDQPLLHLAGETWSSSRSLEAGENFIRDKADHKRPSLSPVQAAENELPGTALARLVGRPEGADYPGPREWAAPPIIVESLEHKSTAAAEGALDLSPRDRRQIQRRLSLAGFNPNGVDGIFGPDTRAAIREWQAASGALPTGYLAERSLAILILETEEEYRGWRVAERARSASQTTRTAKLASPLPPPSPESGERCDRDPSGHIIYGQGVKCDFRGLKETVRQLFRGARRPHDVAQAERKRTSDGA